VMGNKSGVGRQPKKIGETTVWILPSPSPLAANHWDIGPWAELAKAVKATP
jgi:double-stranded uracil-DNA glycosylase